MTPRRLSLVLALLAAAFLLARGPLHLATWALPVSNDDAILLLMGRHVLRGEFATTLWNQPYNGALDAYLLAPLLAILGHHAAYRLYQLACAALLVLLAARLAGRSAGSAAAFAAGLLAAIGTPYMALMTTTGPPPNFLMPLLTGFPLLAALTRREAEAPRPAVAAGWGLFCGLAVWNSSLAVPAFAGIALGLALAGWRPRPRAALLFAAGAALGVAPLLVARAIGASGAKVVTASSAVTALRPRWLWLEGARDLAGALVGLLGLQVPLVVDGRERAALPAVLAAVLALGILLGVAAGSRTRGALPLLGWAAALAGAFWLSRRTDADQLRYLYGMNPPVMALLGAGVAVAWRWRRAAGVALALALAVPWAWGTHELRARWLDPGHAERVWEVPSLEPVIGELRAVGTRSAYSSLQFAGRLTLETEGDVIASQAWNERIPGDPLRFRDEVDLDPAPAWVLSQRFSRGMPRAGGFRDLLTRLGGSCSERPAATFVVFHACRAPYDEARPVHAGELSLATTGGVALGKEALDRDPATAWTASAGIGRGSGLVVRVARARRLAALVLLVSLESSPLAVPWTSTIGGEVVAQGPVRAGFQWVNGAPRAGKQALLVVPLGERVAAEVRLVFQGPGPRLSVAEAFVYGPDEPVLPPGGAEMSARAYEEARAGRWDDALERYAAAVRLEPHRASHHAAWARARWRAAGRRCLDVESLDDGGPGLVDLR